jgi:hypothetical protein
MDGKITSDDIAAFVRTQWCRIAALTVIAAVVGGGLSFLQARVWQATSVIQIGQVDEAQPTVLEPPEQVVARMRSDSFTSRVLAQVPLSAGKDEATVSELVRHTLHADALSGTSFVQLSVRAFSPGDAEAVLAEAQRQLIAIHSGLESGAVDRLHTRLSEIDRDIETAKARHDRLDARLAAMTGGAKGGQKAVDALLNDMMSSTTHDQLIKLQAERADVVMRLSADHTYNTRPIGAIVVSRRPVAPKRSLYVAFGALVGLLLGLLFTTSRHNPQRKTIGR